MNATKHGLTARSPVTVGENAQEFEEMLEAYRRQLQPVGVAEDGAVEAIASAIWRKRRAQRLEACFIDEVSTFRSPEPTIILQEEDELDQVNCEIELALALLGELDDWDEDIDFNATETSNALLLPLVLFVPSNEMTVFPLPNEPERWTVAQIWSWLARAASAAGMPNRRTLLEQTLDRGHELARARKMRQRKREMRGATRLFRPGTGFDTVLRYEARLDKEIERGYRQLYDLRGIRSERDRHGGKP